MILTLPGEATGEVAGKPGEGVHLQPSRCWWTKVPLEDAAFLIVRGQLGSNRSAR